MQNNLIWYKVLDNSDFLAEGRVMTVTAGNKDVCLSHYQGKFTALENKCPHQGGPLGEGSIENGLLRCPWHGWDFCPHGGNSADYDDGLATFPLKLEEKAVYVGIEREPDHVQTISDVMVKTMVNWGVTSVFGMVGHSNLGLADAMRRLELEDKLKFIGVRHEGAASFAASAYGKLTGKPAACFAIAGPGSTNMYTGLWDAKVDRAPVLALTGQVATQVVGTGNFQELDLVQAFSSLRGFNHRVELQSKHAELMSLAIKHAILNRNVSHLTFPDQVQVIEVPDQSPSDARGRMPSLIVGPSPEQLDHAIAALAAAEKPVIVVGFGAKQHMKAIIELAEELNCPVLTTFKAKGQISDYHPLGCGVLGRSGTPVASFFMNEADLLIVIGASFSNHTGITPKIKTIQIDFDPLAIAKFHKIDIPVLGEISNTVWQIYNRREELKVNKIDRKDQILERWNIWRSEKAKRIIEDRGQGVSSIAVFEALTRLSPPDAIMCVDVGNNAYSFGRYFECRQQSFLMSGYLGSIGFALPAAIGAWAAVGDQKPVVAVAGDGGLCQYLAEITTLVKYNMPVKIIVLNNNELGKITKEQRSGGWAKWSTELVNPNFAEFAKNCGALGIYVDNRAHLETAILKLFQHQGPALLEVATDVKLI